MHAPYVSPGWYPSPESRALLRYWDGEMWTNSTRPADNSASASGSIGGPEYFVQHSELVAAELRNGESIQLGYRSMNANTGRRKYVVVTDQRIFILSCNYFRRSKLDSVESLSFDEIDTVGKAGLDGIITSANRTITIPYHGGNIDDVVAWIRLQIDSADDAVNIRALPGPTSALGESLDHQPESVGAQPSAPLGVADEIRKLGDLLKEGLLTDDEFAAQKQRLLDS